LSLKRRIGTVTGLSVAANLAAIAKHAAIASRFGVTGLADLIAYGEAILLFLPTILLVRECFGLFVSVYGRHLETEGIEAAAELFGSGLRVVVLVGALLTLLVFLFPTTLMRLIAPGLPPERLATGAWLLRCVSPALILQEIAEFTKSVHYAHHRYAMPGFALLCGNLLQAALLVAFPVERATLGWILAINAAALLQAAVIVGWAPGISRRVVVSGRFFHPQLRQLARLVGPVAIGVVLIQICGYIERVVLSFLPAGSLAVIAYSRKLIAPLQTVLARSIALPIYVGMSRSREADHPDRAATFSRGIEINLFLFVPVTLFVLLFAPQLVDLVFRRGLFDANAVSMTAPLVRLGVLAIVPASLLLLLRDYFYASAGTRPLVLGAVIHLICTGFANIVLAPRYGVAWVLIGVLVAAWITCGVLLLVVRSQIKDLRWRSLAHDGGKAVIGGGVAIACAVAAISLVPTEGPSSFGRTISILAAGGFAGLIGYSLVTLILRHPLACSLLESLRARR
jgi:putative peptidoglycan lipid II flippase